MANENVKTISLTLRVEDIEFIYQLAHEQDRSASDVVRQIIKKERTKKDLTKQANG